MNKTLSCPSHEQIRQFLLGRLLAAEVDAMELHLAECPACLRAVQHLGAHDEFVAVVCQGLHAETPLNLAETLIARLCDLGLGSQTADPYDPAPDALSIPGYEVQERLGAGGLGVVYKARQVGLGRLVALKFLRLWTALDAEHRARFRTEARAVARMQHPHIVQMYEVGAWEGRPYLALEYLDGGSLAQQLVGQSWDARRAAELVVQLAAAVEAAHRQGVLHRDLKPGNVLLSADGVAKIADFGLAMWLPEAVDSPEASHQTQTGAVLGTPGYMSPEQALGRKGVGPAADIYGLGAILYELLTARPTFRAPSVLETLEQVRTQEPTPPRRLQPRIPRDLETICLKCLHKEPGSRYASAGALADDLGRFLRNEPILARRTPLGERLWKWALRKPALAGLVVVSSLSIAALIAGSLLYSMQQRAAVQTAQASEAAAQRERARADEGYQAAQETLNRMLARLQRRQLGEAPQLKELERELLEDALAFYQRVFERADSQDPKVQFDVAVACQQAATIESMLGRWEAATAKFQQAMELVARLPERERESIETQLLLVGCHNNLGLIANNNRRWEEAAEHHRAALSISERLAGQRPDDPAIQNGLAESERNLGVLDQLLGKRGDAELHYVRAAAIVAKLAASHPDEERYQSALVNDTINLTLLYQNSQRLDQAAQGYATAESLLRPLIAKHPGGDHALSLAALSMNWAHLLQATGQPEAAATKATEAVDLSEGVLRQEPQHQTARSRVFNAHGTRAQMFEAQGRFKEAVGDWDRVVELDQSANRITHRLLRNLTLARAGEHARAASEAQILAVDPEVPREGLYNLACVYALCIKPARTDGQLTDTEREALPEQYARRAITLLKELQVEGYFNDAAHLETLRTDEDLQTLRSRDDFKELLP